MIDWIKIMSLPVDWDELLRHPLLEPIVPVNTKTGAELDKPPEAMYKGLKFIFHPNRVELHGSLHKFFHNGLHNYDDFSLGDLNHVLDRLELTFGIDKRQAVLNNLEIGVNLSFPPSDFLKAMIMHKSKLFSVQTGHNKFFRECIHHQYYIKSYDKGKQYGQDRDILRFEVKVTKMERLKKLGISRLEDLTRPTKYLRLGAYLVDLYDECLIGGIGVSYKGLNTRDKELFILGHNANFWLDLKPESGEIDYRRRYKVYERRLKRFKELLVITGADSMKNKIRNLMKNKIQELTEGGDHENFK